MNQKLYIMKKRSIKNFDLNKKSISTLTTETSNGGALPSRYEKYQPVKTVHSDLVSLPVAGNCATDTFALSCICSG